MEKKQLFRILNFTESSEVISFGTHLEAQHDVAVLKKPKKTLVVLKLRESARNSLFYAGEALACECMVAIGNIKGFAAALGDDLEKVYAMAVIDAAMNADLPEKGQILDKLGSWESKLCEKRAQDSKIAMSTKVNFNIMEE
ncbi:MAG: phosphonate C-P lyase system protein PhnG [Oscillospiraceae bacterium]|nr:phosphonate C-P lyase system protein PhnG [Oscillospiraceae bacterium]